METTAKKTKKSVLKREKRDAKKLEEIFSLARKVRSGWTPQ